MNIKDKGPTGQPSLPRWEYRAQAMEVEADLIQFGQEGWELVAVVSLPHDPSKAIFHFKRRR